MLRDSFMRHSFLPDAANATNAPSQRDISSLTSMISDATSRQGTDLGLKTAKETKVLYPKLDIADPASIQAFAKSIEKDKHTVNVLINNAGVNLDDDYTPENVKATLDTNVRGTLQVSSYPIISSLKPDHADVPNLHPPPKQHLQDRKRQLDRLVIASVQQGDPAAFPEPRDDIRRSRGIDARISGHYLLICLNLVPLPNEMIGGSQQRHRKPKGLSSASIQR